MNKRPGGPIASRPLYINFLIDASGSMSVAKKMTAVNDALRLVIPELQVVAHTQPSASIRVRRLRFANGADWCEPPVPIAEWKHRELVSESLSNSNVATDVVFLIDTSGSMADEIDAVKNNCMDFANKVSSSGGDVRLGLAGFDIGGCRGNQTAQCDVTDLGTYTVGAWPLCNPETFRKHVQELYTGQFGGSGCYLANADTVDIFSLISQYFQTYDRGSHRFLVIVSDEIGGNEGVPEIVATLRTAKAVAHVLGVPGRSGAHEAIASQTGGQFWSIFANRGRRDFSNLLGTVADTIGKEVHRKLPSGELSMGTDLGAALRLVLHTLENTEMPQRSLPPVFVLVSDGCPTDDYKTPLAALNRNPWWNRSVRLAIGVGRDADHSILNQFIGNPEIPILQANNADTLAAYIRWASTAIVQAISTPVVHYSTSSAANGFILPRPPEETPQENSSSEHW